MITPRLVEEGEGEELVFRITARSQGGRRDDEELERLQRDGHDVSSYEIGQEIMGQQIQLQERPRRASAGWR